jgi:hypothetical protein
MRRIESTDYVQRLFVDFQGDPLLNQTDGDNQPQLIDSLDYRSFDVAENAFPNTNLIPRPRSFLDSHGIAKRNPAKDLMQFAPESRSSVQAESSSDAVDDHVRV